MNKVVPIKTKIERRIEIDEVAGCWNWTGTVNNYGYAMLSFNRDDGSRTTTTAHRKSYEAFVGPIPPGIYVCHRCDNPRCVNPEHLFLGTQQENIDDMIAKGRDNYGHGRRPFTHPIEIMKKAANDNRPPNQVAKEYGVAGNTIRRWKAKFSA